MPAPIFQEEGYKYEILPCEFKYSFRKKLQIPETFLNFVHYKVILKNPIELDVDFYINQNKITSYWTDYYRVYGKEYISGEWQLLWQGLIPYQLWWFPISESWRAKYTTVVGNQFQPIWRTAGGLQNIFK
jgi:hypothetical protein